MHALANGRLTVELLDPVADRERLGTRFCWGGYIWQVRDTGGRDLLAGPQWPEQAPDPFNGQGLPEVLRHSELETGRPLTHRDGRGIIPGVGTAKWIDGQPSIVEPAHWHVSRETGAFHYCTQQTGWGFSMDINRTVILEDSTVLSKTSVTNRSTFPVPLHWFAHPFFPLIDGWINVDIEGDVGMEENPGFVFQGGRLEMRRRISGTDDGHFQALRADPGVPFAARMAHPTVGGVEMRTSLPAGQLYVWANGNTFSIEPYLLRTLEPEEVLGWWVSYRFGGC